MGVMESRRAARETLLGIIPERALDLPVLSGRTGPQHWHMLMEPAAIRRVLPERVEDYPGSLAATSILRLALGEGLFVAEGDHWRWQRRRPRPFPRGTWMRCRR